MTHTALTTTLHRTSLLGCLALLSAATLVVNPASALAAKRIKAPIAEAAALSLFGSGAPPLSIIQLSAGSAQALETKVDGQGHFRFDNLKYNPGNNLTFNLTIPKRAGPVAAPAAQLKITYKAKGSRVLVSGNIGKAGTMSLQVGGAKAPESYVAGLKGDISFSSRSSIPVSSGLSEIKASVISVSEICCPQMIVPSPPINIVIASLPTSAGNAAANPAKLAPSLKNAPIIIPPTSAPRSAPAQNNNGPAYIVPVAPSAPAPAKPEAPSDKKVIPYIIQGSVTMPSLVATTKHDAYAISFSSSDYDATWSGGLQKLSSDLRNAAQMGANTVAAFIDGVNEMTAIRTVDNSLVNTMKDYTVSDQVCRFGTLSRSLALTQNDAEANKLAFSHLMNDINSRRKGSIYEDPGVGSRVRMSEFQTKYCKGSDSNNFLNKYCSVTVTDPDKIENNDVDFTRVFDAPLTLDIDLKTASGTQPITSLTSLFRNLTYIPPYDSVDAQKANTPDTISVDQSRQLNAVRSVANNSISALVGDKVKGSTASAQYMYEVLKKLGLDAAEAKKLIGDNPSYNAQMEILTKKIYQDPAFFANLMDSPQNVDRQRVAMKAISLQQDRDYLESLRRREMLLSALLSLKLKGPAFDANASGNVAGANTKP